MCFSLGWIEDLAIELIILFAVVALIKLLLVPYVLAPIGAGGTTLIRAVDIIVWCVVAVFVVMLIFGLLRCLAYPGALLVR